MNSKSVEACCERPRVTSRREALCARASGRSCSIDGSMVDDLDSLWDELGVELRAHRLKILRRLRLAAGLPPAPGRAESTPPPLNAPAL